MSEEKKKATEAVEPEVEANDWREKYLRTLAELDNFRKRMERERELGRRYALEDMMRALLPVLDHLQAACAAEGDASQIREGVALALKDALKILGDKGLKEIEALGKPFDPRFHEAMTTVFDPEYEPGMITAQLSPGYTMHDRVLRPSRVAVAVAPPEPEESEDEATED